MTDKELTDLVASLAIQSAKTDEQFAKNAIQSAKTDAQIAKNAIQSAKTDAQLAKNAIQSAKTDAQIAKNAIQSAKTDAQIAKTDAQIAKTDAKLEKSAVEFNKGMDRLQKSQDKTDAQIAETNAQLAKNAIQFAKTDAQLAKNAIQFAETDAQIAKTDAQLAIQFAETNAQIAETNATFKKLGIFTKNMNQKVEGISKSTGEEAQEFFLSSLIKDSTLGDVEFDRIVGDVLMRFKGQCHQMDIFLENGDSVGIVEVKHKVRTDDIEQLKNIVAKFHQFYPKFEFYKIIPALAGKIFPKHLQDKTLKAGFVVLTQQGDHIEQRVP